jgi:hypothetical protein
VVKRIYSTVALAGLFTSLIGCDVGSDQSTQPNSSTSTQPAQTSTVQAQSVRLALSTAPATVAVHTQTYYLVMHGLNAKGERIGTSLEYQKSVSLVNNPSVQLIWFEPNRKADGTCLQDLSGYNVEYGLQPASYNTSLNFDLASRDMSCATVGVTECGDVRECRYNLTL